MCVFISVYVCLVFSDKKAQFCFRKLITNSNLYTRNLLFWNNLSNEVIVKSNTLGSMFNNSRINIKTNQYTIILKWLLKNDHIKWTNVFTIDIHLKMIKRLIISKEISINLKSFTFVILKWKKIKSSFYVKHLYVSLFYRVILKWLSILISTFILQTLEQNVTELPEETNTFPRMTNALKALYFFHVLEKSSTSWNKILLFQRMPSGNLWWLFYDWLLLWYQKYKRYQYPDSQGQKTFWTLISKIKNTQSLHSWSFNFLAHGLSIL